MSLNTANTPDGRGVLIYNGEMILLYSKGVNISFPSEKCGPMKKSCEGFLYLTSHRVIFISGGNTDLKSFSMPFHCMNDVKLEQPVLGANYLRGHAVPQPGGNLSCDVTWKIHFNKGGCIDFGRALLKAADMAHSFRPYDAPPVYQPPQSDFYAPPPEYYMAPNGYNGFQAPTHAFPDQPPQGSVFVYDQPPPYSGIGPTPENGMTRRNVREYAPIGGNHPTPSAPPSYEASYNAPPLPSKPHVE
uniref:GRAM domain-containing protein n=1 Tax=Rhabditophanes sp. KR3021 TaxID=114890 RepID=A0AC35U597_9BILA